MLEGKLFAITREMGVGKEVYTMDCMGVTDNFNEAVGLVCCFIDDYIHDTCELSVTAENEEIKVTKREDFCYHSNYKAVNWYVEFSDGDWCRIRISRTKDDDEE